jgi:hypothetical protein
VTLLNDDNIVAAMKRAIAPPGEFDTTYPSLTDDDVAAYVADGFGLAQLDGWFPTYSLDINVPSVDPDLSTAAQSLVIAYAAAHILRQRIVSLQAGAHYKAGPVEYSTTAQSNVLVALLNAATAQIDRVRTQVATRITPTIGDLVSIRMMGIVGLQFDSTELPAYNIQATLGELY